MVTVKRNNNMRLTNTFLSVSIPFSAFQDRHERTNALKPKSDFLIPYDDDINGKPYLPYHVSWFNFFIKHISFWVGLSLALLKVVL